MTEYDSSDNTESYEGEGDSILDIDTSDAQEPTVVEGGEYLIRITGFKKDDNGKIARCKEETGNRFFIPTFDIPDEEFSKGFSGIMSLPNDTMDAKQLNACKWALEVFKRAFQLDELNFANMIGKTAYAILGIKNDEYGEQNTIKKFITGA